MHEVVLITEAFKLTLIFADVRYQFLGHDADFNTPKQYPIPSKSE